MPNITDFNAGNIAIRPSEVGVEAFAAAGRRTGAFYNQAAQDERRVGQEIGQSVREAGDAAVTYMDHQAIAAGSATGMKLFSDLEDSKSEATKNIPIDDPLYGQKVETALKDWRENSMEPALQQWQNSGVFNTQKSADWAEHHVEMLRDHLFTQTMSDISSAAGIGVTNAARSNLNEAVNVALNNPAGTDAAIAGYRHAIQGLIASSPVKGIDSAKIQEHAEENIRQIVRAGLAGAIRNAPDPEKAAGAYATKYASYLDASDAINAGRAAKTQAKVNASYDKQTQLAEKQLEILRTEQAHTKVMNDNVSSDANGNVVLNPNFFKDTLQILRDHPNSPNAASTVQTMLSWGQARQVEATKLQQQQAETNSAHTEFQLLSDALDPKKSLDDVKQAAMKANGPDHTLTDKDFSHVWGRIKEIEDSGIRGPEWTAALAYVKSYYAPGGGIFGSANPDNERALQDFMRIFLPDYTNQLRAGKSKTDLLNTNDPNSLISKTMKLVVSPMGNLTGAPSTPSPTSPPHISTQAEFDALPKGASYYVDGDAVPHLKP